MSTNLLDTLFQDRRSVSNPEGMQIFAMMLLGKTDAEAIELHTMGLLHILLFSRQTVPAPSAPSRTMAGLIAQTQAKGLLPHRWHIEYLGNRWFKKVEKYPSWCSELVTECRLVVDEWVDPNPA